MSEIVIREATCSDVAALRLLEQELIEFERPFDRFMLESDVTYYDLDSLISNTNSIVYLAAVDATVVASGYGKIVESKPFIKSDYHCYLGFIYVKPEYRGQGLARRVVQQLFEWANSQDVRHFLLDVYSENKGAISAYEKIGFNARSVSMELML